MDIRFGVVTVSDRSASGERVDASGPILVDAIRIQGWSVNKVVIIPDDLERIKATLATWADSDQVDVILTTSTGRDSMKARSVTAELVLVTEVSESRYEALRRKMLLVTTFIMPARPPPSKPSKATAGPKQASK